MRMSVAYRTRSYLQVILSGGAINSPQLLMLSGVGDAAHLKDVGVPVVHHLPAVGQNMEDHLDLYIQYKCKKPITLHNATWCVSSPALSLSHVDRPTD